MNKYIPKYGQNFIEFLINFLTRFLVYIKWVNRLTMDTYPA